MRHLFLWVPPVPAYPPAPLWNLYCFLLLIMPCECVYLSEWIAAECDCSVKKGWHACIVFRDMVHHFTCISLKKAHKSAFFPLPRSQLNSGFMGFRPYLKQGTVTRSKWSCCFTICFQTSGSFYTIRAYQHCLSVVNSAREKRGIPHPASHPSHSLCILPTGSRFLCSFSFC